DHPRRRAGVREVRPAERTRRLPGRNASRDDDGRALARGRAARPAGARGARPVGLRAVDLRARRTGARRPRPGGGLSVARPVTLFTGQWADLPLEDLAGKA